jgi:hypothetical protein
LVFDDLIKSKSEAYSEVVRERTWANFASAAETRLLPEGKIAGISTRWHLDDVHGRLLRRAQEDKRARQFLYVSLGAWNDGEDSFVLDTRTGERKSFPRYRVLASIQGQPYSFSRHQLLGKQADLGSSRFSALYMQQPMSLEDQLLPEKVWGTQDQVNADDLLLVASAWDCASRTGESSDAGDERSSENFLPSGFRHSLVGQSRVRNESFSWLRTSNEYQLSLIHPQ